MPTIRTLNWSRPMGLYPSYRGYDTPRCATYVCMCLTSLPSMAPGDRVSLTSDRRSYSGTITSSMASNFCAGAHPLGKTAKDLPTRREGWPSVPRAYKTPIYYKGQKLTHSPAHEEKPAGQETPLQYTE